MSMVLRVFNTMSGTEEEFIPIHGNRVNMFVCGPTVYDHTHIGHARTYLAYDIVSRYLRFKGYSVFYLMNLTDVDDKIIDRAKEKNIHPLELSRHFTEEFLRDLALIGVSSTNLFAKASEHIPEIIRQITQLLEKKCAYRVNGDIYFDISKFPDYGRLSHQNPEELKRHRIEPDPRKRDPSDFSLWKSREKGELGWESPWGWGRPGWHIEDTAITETYFGEQYDIHGGAIELVFPHHEAEIAQAESASGKKPLVRYWIHTGMVNVKGQKMSKSLGNFVTIREVLEKYDPNVLRVFFASSHYRSPIDYTPTNLQNAQDNYRRIANAYTEAQQRLGNAPLKEETNDLEFLKTALDLEKEFMEAMDDDFNTPVALSTAINFAKRLEAYAIQNPGKNSLSPALQILGKFSSILGISLSKSQDSRPKILDGLVSLVMDLRNGARARNDWTAADKIRDRLSDLKIYLEDTQSGTRWRRTD
jgi:cysteinyl-tRNA synthetase